MTFRFSSKLTVLSALVLALAIQAAGAAETANAANADWNDPLPVDPNVKMGVLPNKFSYWIRAHKTPPGKVNIWLHVGSGSINEDDNQRGLAHFLEHMAFNGSANFAAGTLVKYFEALGLRFGQDQNAFTYFDQTTYKLTLPDTKPETIQKGLTCLADFGYRLLLPSEKLEIERNVILEESRTRKGAQQRITDKLLPLIAPGSRFSQRLPIGLEDIVKSADRQRFVDYYSKWYRPDNSTLIVCGDIDPAAIEKMVQENFSDWKCPEAAVTSADPGIKEYTDVRASVITDPELTATEVAVKRIGPLLPRNTVADFRREMVENLADWILNRRYSEMVANGTAPFQDADVNVSPYLNVCRSYDAEAEGSPENTPAVAGGQIQASGEKWAAMLTSLLIEMKRAREFGFLQQETDDAKKESLSNAEQAAKTEGTWEAERFIAGMNNNLSQKLKPLAQAQRLELVKTLLPGITREELGAAFRIDFDARARLLLVVMPEKKELKPPAEQEILDVAAKAEATRVEPPHEKERSTSLLAADPAPGIVIAQEDDPDLKIYSGTFENGVRVHLRSMDFKKNEVLVSITIAGGAIRENAASRGLSDAAGLLFSQPASSKLSSTTIRDLLTGKTVTLGGGAGEDSFSLGIHGSPQDIEDGLRLFYLLMTDGKIEETALKKWKEEVSQLLDKKKTDVRIQANEKRASLLSGDDLRIKPLTQEQLDRITLGKAQAWLEGILKNGPVEAAIVGDIPRERALELARKYFGSLPKREVADKELDALRMVAQNPGPLTASIDVSTITPKAYVIAGWRGPDWAVVKDRRILQLAGQILSIRIRQEIREKRGLAYSPFCAVTPSKAFSGAGLIAAMFDTAPEKAAAAASIASDLIETFAKEGPTQQELDDVRKQIKNDMETRLKEPSYWAFYILGDLDFHGTKLSDVKEVVEKFTTYTKEDILEVLKRYITAERQIQVIAAPLKKDDSAAPPKP